MKKIILLALTALMMVGCYDSGDSLQRSSYSYATVTYDSCEYVIGNFTERMAHKGNCRFCKERRQKELEELIIKLKEK